MIIGLNNWYQKHKKELMVGSLFQAYCTFCNVEATNYNPAERLSDNSQRDFRFREKPKEGSLVYLNDDEIGETQQYSKFSISSGSGAGLAIGRSVAL